jgi:hypothetical protein
VGRGASRSINSPDTCQDLSIIGIVTIIGVSITKPQFFVSFHLAPSHLSTLLPLISFPSFFIHSSLSLSPPFLPPSQAFSKRTSACLLPLSHARDQTLSIIGIVNWQGNNLIFFDPWLQKQRRLFPLYATVQLHHLQLRGA